MRKYLTFGIAVIIFWILGGILDLALGINFPSFWIKYANNAFYLAAGTMLGLIFNYRQALK